MHLEARSVPRPSAVILRRMKVILLRTTTVLIGVLDCSFILSGGACHGGKHGHASLRLPGYWRRSFHGHRNGPCDAPAIGAVESLLSTLPSGGMAAPLTNPIWIYGSDDDTLFRLIVLGTLEFQ